VSAPADLAGFAAELRSGGVVAVPTDTVYGLAVDPRVPGASRRVFDLKRRPDAVALPVLVHSVDQAIQLASADSARALEALASRFWPGALTVVVTRGNGVDLDLGGDPTTVGLRCPDRPELRALCELVGPLAVTSANVHGRVPCTTPGEVRACFGADVSVLEGGACAGVPSTVVLLVGGAVELRRPGPVTIEEIRAVLAGTTEGRINSL
jgi:L-threonylcarbamoyladenylate synthase